MIKLKLLSKSGKKNFLIMTLLLFATMITGTKFSSKADLSDKFIELHSCYINQSNTDIVLEEHQSFIPYILYVDEKPSIAINWSKAYIWTPETLSSEQKELLVKSIHTSISLSDEYTGLTKEEKKNYLSALKKTSKVAFKVDDDNDSVGCYLGEGVESVWFSVFNGTMKLDSSSNSKFMSGYYRISTEAKEPTFTVNDSSKEFKEIQSKKTQDKQYAETKKTRTATGSTIITENTAIQGTALPFLDTATLHPTNTEVLLPTKENSFSYIVIIPNDTTSHKAYILTSQSLNEEQYIYLKNSLYSHIYDIETTTLLDYNQKYHYLNALIDSNNIIYSNNIAENTTAITLGDNTLTFNNGNVNVATASSSSFITGTATLR